MEKGIIYNFISRIRNEFHEREISFNFPSTGGRELKGGGD